MALWPGVLDPTHIDTLAQAAERIYARIAAQSEVEQALRYVPSSHSFGLEAVVSAAHWTAGLPQALHDAIRAHLGGPFAAIDTQCWVRRQVPEAQRASTHHPHSWHQDGACGHDFVAGAASEGLVPMVTLWVPLTACGEDAPGLELVATDAGDLVGLSSLAHPHPEAPRWAPAMAPGDVLLMLGSVVHRTHVTATMSHPRTSIEVRYARADAWPTRFGEAPIGSGDIGTHTSAR